MPTILITGGTGLIGKAITKELLKKEYKVIILTRNLRNEKLQTINDKLSYAAWNIGEQTIDRQAIALADHIIHLAGAGIADKRWTKKRKKDIADSRIKSSELVVKALKETDNKVKLVISASAIGWYGSDSFSPGESRGGAFIETDPSANDFLGTTCKLWEESIEPVTQLNKRLVKFRSGIVLSNDGGAYAEFKKPLRFGIAPILGTGNQVISWIHIDDMVRMYISAIENENFSGVYNAVAPNPVNNKEFMLALAKQLKGKYYIPVYVPSFALKLALGEMSVEVLKSATVSCKRIAETGFEFRHPDIISCIKQLSSH